MPRKSQRIERLLFRFLFLSLAGWALSALRGETARGKRAAEPAREPEFVRPEIRGRAKLEHWEEGRTPPSRRRAALAMTFSVIFFAGAALTAGAGDQGSKLLEENAELTAAAEESAAPAEQPAAPEVPAEPAPAEPEPAPEAAPAPEVAPEAEASAPERTGAR